MKLTVTTVCSRLIAPSSTGIFLRALLFIALLCFSSAQAQLTNYSLVHSFKQGNAKGLVPRGGLREGSDGALYGMASEGGHWNQGTLFRLNTNGSGFAVLHHFGSFASDGRRPSWSLIEASDGRLYGVTTAGGGTTNVGTVFRIGKDGAGYEILHRFTGNPDGGTTPLSGLLEGSDGALYGMGDLGKAFGIPGTVFKMNKDGSAFQVIQTMQGTYGPRWLYGPLVEGTNGMLYGTSLYGGYFGDGTIFSLNKDGSNFSVVRDYGTFGYDGAYPNAGLVRATDGRLYGTTSWGGFFDYGTLILAEPDSDTILMWFAPSTANNMGEGRNPATVLIQGQDNYLYGTCDRGGTNDSGVVFKVGTDGEGYTVLHRFNWRTGDGVRARGDLIQARDGALYGTTREGGSANKGTIYKLRPDGSGYQILVNFDAEGAESWAPVGALVEAMDQKFYGVADNGGQSFKGAVFRMNRDGSGYTELHSFSGEPADGSSPEATLIAASDGRLYGTTRYGGLHEAGILFGLDRNGDNYAVLHHFQYSTTNGASPAAALLEGSDGKLYGTTVSGGSNSFGIAFAIQMDAQGFTILRSFTSGSNDVRHVASPLIEASDGILYGSGVKGDDSLSRTFFKLNKDGSGFAVLRSIPRGGSQENDVGPRTTLIEGSDGWLYGTMSTGGSTNKGIVFKLSKDGNIFTILHDFLGAPADGASPRASLTEGRDGALYGSTYSGGASNAGTLFKLNKDGGGFLLLRSYASSGAGGFTPAFVPLLSSSDGAFYGATPGNTLSPADEYAISGFVFRLGHALAVTLTNSTAMLAVTGIPGYNYEVQRSTNLTAWTTLHTVVASESGPFHFTDTNPPAGASFYRVHVP